MEGRAALGAGLEDRRCSGSFTRREGVKYTRRAGASWAHGTRPYHLPGSGRSPASPSPNRGILEIGASHTSLRPINAFAARVGYPIMKNDNVPSE